MWNYISAVNIYQFLGKNWWGEISHKTVLQRAVAWGETNTRVFNSWCCPVPNASEGPAKYQKTTSSGYTLVSNGYTGSNIHVDFTLDCWSSPALYSPLMCCISSSQPHLPSVRLVSPESKPLLSVFIAYPFFLFYFHLFLCREDTLFVTPVDSH